MILINDSACVYDTATRHLLNKLSTIVDQQKRVYIDPGNTVYHWRRGPNDFKVKLETANTVVRELLRSATASPADFREFREGGKPYIEIYVTVDIAGQSIDDQPVTSNIVWDDDFA